MNKDLYELVARMRDHYLNQQNTAQACVDVCERILKTGEKHVLQKYDMSKINFEPKEGTKGTYNLATKSLNPNNTDFDACMADLKSRNGKPLRHQGMFIWMIGDEGTAFGFKPAEQAQKKPQAKEAPLVPPAPAEVAAPAKPAEPPAQPTIATTAKSVDDVKALFPKDLEDMLFFELTESHVTIKPRQYLGSENFAKIAAVVRDNGGEYISAGKESHFRIPR